MERNVNSAAREAQSRVEQDTQSNMRHTTSGPSSYEPKTNKKNKKKEPEDESPSATSKFSRKWSFKKLSMMNKKHQNN